MFGTSTIQNNLMSVLRSKATDYAQFFKLRLASLVVFSSIIGYLFANNGPVNFVELTYLFLGGFLIVGSSNGINQIIEREYDRLMTRTENRPVATKRMSVLEASLLATFAGVVGIAIIAIQLNALAALLGFIALVSYAFIYTPFKRVNSIAVFLGAFPGALPILIGYTAVTGTITFDAVLLFMVQFIWQFPHFWAIAWILHEDYNKAGFKLMPSMNAPGKRDAIQILIYTITLIPIGLMLFVMGYTGWISAIVVTLTALFFLKQALDLYRTQAKAEARKLMFGSFLYLPVVQIAYLLDKI